MGWFSIFRRRSQGPRQRGAMLLDRPITDVVAGRQRVVGIPYTLPADDEEINRLDFQHYMLRFAFQGNFAAPLTAPTSILDVGAGTGRWAVEMAQTFPNANVIGIDVKPPAVDARGEMASHADPRPQNYTFILANLLEGLPFPDGSFDYTHQRLLFTAIPHDRWPGVAQELTRVTRPSGWVELVDSIGLANGGPNVELLMDWIRELSARRNVDLMDGARIGDYLRGAPLINQSVRRIDLPTGLHGGRLGKMVATDFFSVCKGFGGIVVAQRIASQNAWDTALERAQHDLNTSMIPCVTPFFIALGQKPD
ncbi:MAG: methyltransferase domain-containing protein [Chloroflexota bacterium]|nr:methyltransferase domain-containing protein [Chloroflexota bacterium]